MREPEKLDVALLRKAVDWVDEQDKLPLRQCEWAQGSWRTPRSCGTAYCVAGYIAEISGADWVSEDPDHPHYDDLKAEPGETGAYLTEHGLITSVHSRALALLGINNAHGLFSAENNAQEIRQMAEEIAAVHGEKL